MIAHLAGELIAAGETWVVIDVGGVGYRVTVTRAAAEALRGTEGAVRLHTKMIVRDDDILLYGFLNPGELDLFGILITVTGIGPQTAMNILSRTSLEEFAAAVVNEDEKALTRIPGIGQKSAKRLILELKEKMKGYAAAGRPPKAADAVSALISLGFPPAEAEDAVAAVLPGLPEPDVQSLIRAALARLREE